MRGGRRTGVWLAAAVLAATGCRAPDRLGPVPPPTPPPPPPALPLVAPTPLEPNYQTLPTFDPTVARVEELAPPPSGYRGLTEEQCRREAAARASVAGLFVRENRIPPRRGDRNYNPAADLLTRGVRVELAAEGRNRAAADALDEFFQLADAEGRGEILRETLPVLDQLRGVVRKARAEGVRVPLDPDELDRQRATLLGLIGQADLGARTLDIDLRRRIGYPGGGTERLRPVGDFGVRAEVVDVEAAVRMGLQRRPDLLGLREAYRRLSPDSLPAVREMLRGTMTQTLAGAGNPPAPGGLIGRTAAGAAVRPVVAILLTRWRSRQLDEAVLAELEVRRQQMFDLVVERERQTADEVRAAAANLDAQATQVALARWKAEQLAGKVADVKGQGPLFELQAELEWLRARADVVAAVMNWHRARAKLAAAIGVLGGDDPAAMACQAK